MRGIQLAVPMGPARLYESKVVGSSLSEQEILMLQDAFLYPGMHYITVQNMALGRLFIYKFLQSLSVHHAAGCLTMDGNTLEHNMADVKREMLGKRTVSYNEETIETFLLDRFYDFMWIELSDELKNQKWYRICLDKLHELKIDEQIPIILLDPKEQ